MQSPILGELLLADSDAISPAKKVVCFDVLRCFLSVRSPNGKKAERKEKTADIEKTNMSAVR